MASLNVDVPDRTAELVRSVEALQAELQERVRAEKVARSQVNALAKTLELLVAEPERDKFIAQVVKAIAEQLDARSASFWLYDLASQTTSLFVDYRDGAIVPSSRPESTAIGGTEPWRIFEASPRPPETPCHRVFTIEDDIDCNPDLGQCRDGLAARGIHTLLVIPLFLENEFVGSFSIPSAQPRRYFPAEIELAQALAQQAVLAIQLTRLADQSRQAGVLEERNRIAREIHDTLAQAFTGMLIQLSVAQRIADRRPDEAWRLIEHVGDLARQGLAEARRSVWSLQPEAQEYSDLAGALPRAIAQMTSHSAVEAEVHIHGNRRSLPADVGMHLLRIGQEAVNNALRHADAQRISVELTFDTNQIQICVQDDGHGFELRPEQEASGFGLIGMRQRAERIGGRLMIASQPGVGTEVAVTVPIAPPQAPEQAR